MVLLPYHDCMNEELNSLLRLGFFFGGLVLFTLGGYLFPWRRLKKFDHFRQLNNLLLVIINSVIIRLTLGASILYVLTYTESKNIGLFNTAELPFYIELILSVFVLDLIIYLQHRLFHTIPFFWKLHRVHHTDISYDATTALRFHTIEIFLSILIKLLVVVSLGISPVPFVIFEIILNFSAMFNHGNYSFGRLERVLGLFIVTPAIHRIHHTNIMSEHNSNYGFFLSIWDRIFKTFTPKSQYTKEEMIIGLDTFNKPEDQRIDQLLLQPFRGKNYEKN